MLPEEIQGEAIESAELEQVLPSRTPFWGYADVALVLGLVFAFTVVLGTIVAVFKYKNPAIELDSPSVALPFQLGFYVALYLSFQIVFWLRYKVSAVLGALGWRPSRFNLLLAGGGGILVAFAASALGYLLKTPKIPSPFDKLTNTPGSLIFFAIVAVVLAPIFEELFFRGFLQPLFSRTLGTESGVLLTAVLFGALHGFEYSWVWQYAAMITLVGLALGALRVRAGSIVPCAVMHGCFNAVSVVALLFGKDI